LEFLLSLKQFLDLCIKLVLEQGICFVPFVEGSMEIFNNFVVLGVVRASLVQLSSRGIQILCEACFFCLGFATKVIKCFVELLVSCLFTSNIGMKMFDLVVQCGVVFLEMVDVGVAAANSVQCGVVLLCKFLVFLEER
jgi:hypothetical protein